MTTRRPSPRSHPISRDRREPTIGGRLSSGNTRTRSRTRTRCSLTRSTLRANAKGLAIGYSDKPTISPREVHVSLREGSLVGIDGLSSPQTRVASYSDWSVTAEWPGRPEAPARHLRPRHAVRVLREERRRHAAVNVANDDPREATRCPRGTRGDRRRRRCCRQRRSDRPDHRGAPLRLFAPTKSRPGATQGCRFTPTLDGKDYFSVALLPDASPRRSSSSGGTPTPSSRRRACSWRYDEKARADDPVRRCRRRSKSREGSSRIHRSSPSTVTSGCTRAHHAPDPRIRVAARRDEAAEGASFATKHDVQRRLADVAGGRRPDGRLRHHVTSTTPGSRRPFPRSRRKPDETVLDRQVARAKRDRSCRSPTRSATRRPRPRCSGRSRTSSRTGSTAARPSRFLLRRHLDDAGRLPAELRLGRGAERPPLPLRLLRRAPPRPSPATTRRGPRAWAAFVDLLIARRRQLRPRRRALPVPALHGSSTPATRGPTAPRSSTKATTRSRRRRTSTSRRRHPVGRAHRRHAPSATRHLPLHAPGCRHRAVLVRRRPRVFPKEFEHTAVGMVWGAGGKYDTWCDQNPDLSTGSTSCRSPAVRSTSAGTRTTCAATTTSWCRRSGGQVVTRGATMCSCTWRWPTPEGRSSCCDEDPYFEPEFGNSRAMTYHWINSGGARARRHQVTADVPTYAVFARRAAFVRGVQPRCGDS